MNLPPIKKPTWRMWDWWLLAAAALLVVAWVSPQQLPVIAYKVSLVGLAIAIAYWADHSLFKRVTDRIDETPSDNLGVAIYHAARTLTRGVIVLAVVIGLTAGL